MSTTLLAPLEDVLAIARPAVERIVWCSVATAGPDGPRSRVMHPVWWWDDDRPRALVSARPTPVKVAHLRAERRVSCSYWDTLHETVVIDAVARWVPDAERDRAWAAVAAAPPPLGFDPAAIWPDGPDAPDCGFIELEARRIVASRPGAAGLRWRPGGP